MQGIKIVMKKEDFSYGLDFRIADLKGSMFDEPNFVETLTFVNQAYVPTKDCPQLTIDWWWKQKQWMDEAIILAKEQLGYSMILYTWLVDIATNKMEDVNDSMGIVEFLKKNTHEHYPFLLKRKEQFIEDVKDDRYISCLYGLDFENKLKVAPFRENEVAKVWFNRVKHSQLVDFQNAWATGVMYFCPITKELLYINNASGHYRIHDLNEMHRLKPILDKEGIRYEKAMMADYSDVIFQHPIRF